MVERRVVLLISGVLAAVLVVTALVWRRQQAASGDDRVKLRRYPAANGRPSELRQDRSERRLASGRTLQFLAPHNPGARVGRGFPGKAARGNERLQQAGFS